MTGKELKELRQAAGLTQQALGDMAGTSRRAIAKYEAGEIDLGQIEVKTAFRLARALNIPVDRFDDGRAYQVGTWWNDRDIQLWKIGPDVYALDGWNGEAYLHCWKCTGKGLMDASEQEYEIRPVYRFEAEGIDLDNLEEGSNEWDHACEIVDFNIR